MFYKAINFYKTLNVYKALNIYKILLPLDGHNKTHRVSKAREGRAGGLVLDIEKVTILLSTNVKA